MIRIDFDDFEGEIVHNSYGSAFLIKKNYEADNFEISLAALSFYSAPNSHYFKQINIRWNDQCFALNKNSYIKMSPED